MFKRLLCAVLLFLPGCAYVEPLVQDFNVISIPEEASMGAKMSQEVASQMQIATDSSLNSRVQSIGAQLVRSLERRDFDYQFFVVKDATPNAFTIPGGKIYVHTGLLNFVDDDSELAGVMAHELGHAYARHPAKGLSRQMGVDALSQLLFKGNEGKLRQIALQMAGGGFLTRFSREDELQADELGYYILRSAGLRTDGLLRFLSKLQAAGEGGVGIPFLSTHPPTPERVARLQNLERSGGSITTSVPVNRAYSVRRPY